MTKMYTVFHCACIDVIHNNSIQFSAKSPMCLKQLIDCANNIAIVDIDDDEKIHKYINNQAMQAMKIIEKGDVSIQSASLKQIHFFMKFFEYASQYRATDSENIEIESYFSQDNLGRLND